MDFSFPQVYEALAAAFPEREAIVFRERRLRYADFVTLSRSRTMGPTCSELELYPIVHEIYRQARTRRTPIRLLGIALSNLGHFDEQLSLFDGGERLHRAVDAIRARFGFDSLHLATSTSRTR